MNRRDILKALGALPIAGALGGCRDGHHEPESAPPSSVKVRTLQVLLQGAFALVLQKNHPNRLTAFVPRADAGDTELDHDFFFNDPSTKNAPMTKDPAGYHFVLSADGLRNYPKTYINPGFSDFTADTEKWFLPNRVVTIDLPFPSSINFSGRPLHVTFASGRSGLMPTNHILEYYLDEPDKVKLDCAELGGRCSPSPHCPPGVLRFFFGVAPRMRDDEGQRKHAVKFFNFMLRRCFPDLEGKYGLADIEASEERSRPVPAAVRPADMKQAAAMQPWAIPAVLESAAPRPRLQTVASTVDCQSGGIIVATSTPPTG